MSGSIVGQRRCCVIFARAGSAFATAALVEEDDAVALRIKKPGDRAVAAHTRSTMHDHHRLAGGRPVFLPVDPMVGKSRRGQMAGPDEGWVRRPVCARIVCRRCLGDCIHGVDFCDNGRQVASAGSRQRAGHLTPKSRAASFNEMISYPSSCLATGQLPATLPRPRGYGPLRANQRRVASSSGAIRFYSCNAL